MLSANLIALFQPCSKSFIYFTYTVKLRWKKNEENKETNQQKKNLHTLTRSHKIHSHTAHSAIVVTQSHNRHIALSTH